jgi:hypothetical protein
MIGVGRGDEGSVRDQYIQEYLLICSRTKLRSSMEAFMGLR